MDELSIENIDTMTVYEEKEMSIFVTLNSGTNNFYRYIGAFSLFLYYGGSPWMLDDLNNY